MARRSSYRDDEGNLICSEDMIFDEDIIDETYIKSDWYRDPEQLYIEILKENTKYYNNNIKGKF